MSFFEKSESSPERVFKTEDYVSVEEMKMPLGKHKMSIIEELENQALNVSHKRGKWTFQILNRNKASVKPIKFAANSRQEMLVYLSKVQEILDAVNSSSNKLSREMNSMKTQLGSVTNCRSLYLKIAESVIEKQHLKQHYDAYASVQVDGNFIKTPTISETLNPAWCSKSKMFYYLQALIFFLEKE